MKKLVLLLILLVACDSCYGPSYPTAPQNAANSTFKVQLMANGIPQWMGTAWIVGRQDGKTQLVTAGHVCGAADFDVSVGYLLIAQDGTTHLAMERMKSDAPDLCLLESDEAFGYPMYVARWMPKYGDYISMVGAPRGVYGDGAAPVVRGQYSGGKWVTINGAPGSSGSAVWTSEGVFGVLVSGIPVSPYLCGIVKLEDLKAFLDKAGL